LGIADAIKAKIGSPMTDSVEGFNGRVPRNEEDALVLLGERPSGWEYILFAYQLKLKLEGLSERLSDHRIGYASPGEYVPDGNVRQIAQTELARLSGIVSSFDRVLGGRGQVDAFGAPGDSGDPVLIEHFARRLVDILRDLLNWSTGVLALASDSDESRAVFEMLARFADQPIESIRTFIDNFELEMDGLTERISSGENAQIDLVVKFDLPEKITADYRDAVTKFEMGF
jgi:hypothetical protein